jgi:hypothetical protein
MLDGEAEAVESEKSIIYSSRKAPCKYFMRRSHETLGGMHNAEYADD